MFADGINGWCLFELFVFVDTFLDEDFLQGVEMILFQQFALPDFQLLANEVLRALYRVYQHVADGEELRLLVADDTAVGRDVDFAVGESIEGIECLV